MPLILLLVAVGGAAGAVARYLLSVRVQAWVGSGFPWGTLAVNLIGCVVLGLVMRLTTGFVATAEGRALVAVGFLGAFTTFSTFGVETVLLLQRGEVARAGGYVLASVLFGVLGAFIGLGGPPPGGG